jgi:hypothetical protein
MDISSAGRPGKYLLILALSLTMLTVDARAGEIDRLLAAVNGKIITSADLNLARNLNALVLFGKETENPSLREEIDRLLDLELMRQELENFTLVDEDPQRTEARLLAIRNAYAEIGGLPPLLRWLGLQESELISYLRLQDSILQFVNFRFRPFATVAPEDIRNYYQASLIPQLKDAGAPLPALDEVSSKIEEILKEEKVNSLLDQWMNSLRKDSRIEYLLSAPSIPTAEEP